MLCSFVLDVAVFLLALLYVVLIHVGSNAHLKQLQNQAKFESEENACMKNLLRCIGMSLDNSHVMC